MIDRRTAVSLMSLVPLAFTPAFAEPLRRRGEVPLAQFPFELLANGIYFRAKLNGKGPYLFSLDTGSSNSVIASELVRELGIETGAAFKSTGAGSDSNAADSIHVLDFQLPGGIKRQVNDGAAISLSGLWPLLGKRFYGIIGYDVLRPFVVEIDYAGRTVRLFAPASYTPPRNTFSAHMYGNYDPQIDGSIEVLGRTPIPVRFTLDTGAGGTIVSSPLVDKYDLTSAISRLTDTQDKGVGGAVPTEVMGRLSAIRIGSFVLQRPLVALSRDKMGSLANEAISVNMGGNILKRFTVVIDYAHKTVALIPNQYFREPFRSDASGLMLSADNQDFHKFTVDRVIGHSPAADAAVNAGDVVLAVNGKPAEKLALWELEEELKMNGAQVQLSMRRGDKRVDSVLKLRSLL
jgi:hypothetical protein